MAKLPKHYSLKSDQPHSFEVHDARDGNTFHIAKRDLDTQMHAQLSGLPKFALGGVVDDMVDTAKDYGNQALDWLGSKLPVSYSDSPPPATPSVPQEVSPEEPPQATTQPSEMSPSVPQQGTLIPSPSNIPSGSYSDQFAKAQGNEIAGIQGQANVRQNEGNQTAQAITDSQAKIAEYEKQAAVARDARKAELDSIAKDAATKIDPHRYVNNMSTGNKILASIAMALGGAGAGMAHQQNLAYETIQNAIKQDVESQKDDINNKQTLYSKMLQRYGDEDRATQETIMHMNAAAQGTIAAIAAKSSGALAAPVAQQMIGRLSADNLDKVAAYGQQDAARKMMQSGAQMDAMDLVKTGIIPKEYAADAYKEQQAVNAQKHAIQGANELFDKMDKEQSAGNIGNYQSSQRMKAHKSELVNIVMEASPSKRLTRESVEEEINPILIKTLQNPETRKTLRQTMTNIIRNHGDSTPLLQKYSPGSLPSYEQGSSNSFEGKTATNGSGQRIIMKNGKWVPLGK